MRGSVVGAACLAAQVQALDMKTGLCSGWMTPAMPLQVGGGGSNQAVGTAGAMLCSPLAGLLPFRYPSAVTHYLRCAVQASRSNSFHSAT